MLAIRFLHYLGVALWIGGGLSVSFLIFTLQSVPITQHVGIIVKAAKMYSPIVLLGVILTLGSGILWNMSLVATRTAESPPVPAMYWIMVLAGFMGGLVALFVAMPNALKLGRIPSGEYNDPTPAIERLKKKFLRASDVVTLLGIISLMASVAAT